MIAEPGQSHRSWHPTAVLLSLFAPSLLAFGAFLAGLVMNSALDHTWRSDWRFAGCFGLAFALGAILNLRLTGLLAREGSLVRISMLVYLVCVVALSFVLVGIIHDLRSGN